MKKNILIGLLAIAGLSMTSCNDLLNDNRFPLDQQTNNPEYWNTTANVDLQINYLYSYFLGYGNTTSWVSNFYYRSLSDDQCTHMYSGEGIQFTRWEYQEAPTNTSEWTDGYSALRRINSIIEGVQESSLPTGDKNNYLGIARLNRAYQLYVLVRCFGDVPLVDKVLDPTDTDVLYGPRTPRNEVMDFAFDDIEFATKNIIQQANKLEFSADMAQAIKAEICLFEASFAKYHQKDNDRANKYYQRVIDACKVLMSKGYSLAPNYRSLYNSVFTASAAEGLESLTSNPEVIFMKGYATGVKGHSLLAYLSTGTKICGMTKDAFDAYLFKDGKPLALTSENKSDEVIAEEDGTLSIAHLLDVRDDRLSMTIDPFVAYAGQSAARNNSAPMTSSTGYLVRKYVNPNLSTYICTTDGQSPVCAPIYWLAEIYLAYAEARAELGQLDDNDINMTLNKLYARAGLPAQTKASLESMNDPANNMGISSLLWEVRRCRRCELMFDNYIRYWDLVRWHQLELLDSEKHPNITLGANLSQVPGDMKSDVEMQNNYIDGASNANVRQVRKFTEREYFYPLGKNQMELNPALKQNPGW